MDHRFERDVYPSDLEMRMNPGLRRWPFLSEPAASFDDESDPTGYLRAYAASQEVVPRDPYVGLGFRPADDKEKVIVQTEGVELRRLDRGHALLRIGDAWFQLAAMGDAETYLWLQIKAVEPPGD